MKKRLLLVLCLLMTFFVMTGCALIEKDAVVDAATPIVTLGDIVFTKADVQNLQLYYQQMYAPYGIEAPDVNSIIDAFKQEAVERQVIKERGYDTLSVEEQETVNTNWQSEKESIRNQIRTSLTQVDATLEGDALEKAIDDEMTQYGYTDEYLQETAKESFTLDKLRNAIKAEVIVTEDEARTNYNEKIEADKATYAETLNSFGTSYNAGSQVYYTPAGYRYIKSIQIPFLQEDQDAISAIESSITSQNTLITSIQNQIDAYSGELDDEQQKTLDGYNAEMETAKKALDDLNKQLDGAKEKARTNLAPTVLEVREKIAADEDFNTLIETYGNDKGNVNLSTGYAICEGYTGKADTFVSAAMALKNIGDVTQEDIAYVSGVQILKYEGDAVEGTVDFETVKDLDAITKLTEKQTAAYNDQVAAWIQEYDIKVDAAAMNN